MKKHKYIFYFTGVLIAIQVLGILLVLGVRYLKVLNYDQEIIFWLIAMQIAYVTAILFIIKWFKINLKLSWIKSSYLISGIALLMALFVFIFQMALDKPFFDSLIDGKLRFLKLNNHFAEGSYRIAFFLVSVFIGPIMEEILFRRIIFIRLLEQYKLSVSIVLTSLLFAIMHQSVEGFIAYFFIGVFFTYVYHLTRDMTLNIVIHMLYNLFSNLTLIEIYEPRELMYSVGIFIYVVSALGIFFGIRKVKILKQNV